MTQTTSQAINTLIRATWRATALERPRFYLFVVLFVLAYSIDLVVPWAIGYVLGVFVEKGFSEEAYRLAGYGLAAYIILRLFNTFFHHLARYVQNTVAFSARMHEMRQLFNAFMSFPLRWHVQHHSGENLSKLHRGVGAVDSMVGTYIWQVVEGVVKVVFASAALFSLDLMVALNVLGMGIVTILIMVLFNHQLRKSIRANNAFHDRINRVCVDYLYNIITVKTLRLERSAREYLERQQPEGLSISKRISRFQEFKWGSVGVGYSIVLGTSLIIYFWGKEGFAGPFDVAQVYVLMNYLDRIFAAIGSFTGYYGGILESATAYEDASRLLQEMPPSDAPARVRRIPEQWRSIVLTDLRFAYQGAEGTELHVPFFEIHRGDKVAFVGPSGGGKSTLLKILGGMLAASYGEIRSDGVRALSLDDLGDISLLLPQEPEIFSESVRYNLSMGDSFTNDQLAKVVDLCRVEHVITKLPRGWESDLAESGQNLSVGEKQRVAMARGLLRAAEKDILLLDEPTSSLDPMTEKQIFLRMLAQFHDRTVITACHRLALVPLFDKIVYVRDGRVEEVGKFEELLARKGPFATAWDDYEKRILKEHHSSERPALERTDSRAV